MPKHKPQLHRKLGTRLSMCGGKNCYPSREHAEAVRDEQQLLVRDLELSVYRCHICRQWHLTRARD